MRRHVDDEIGSLEFLLDTMCNTFGGVVFIAVLLSIIMRSTGKSPADEQAALDQRQVHELRGQELTRLQRMVANLDDLAQMKPATAAPVDISKARSTAELAEMQNQNQTQMLRLREELLAAATLQRELMVASTELVKDREEMAKTKRNADNVAREQAALKAERKRVFRLPMVHTISAKRTVFIAFKDRKFYAISNMTARWPSRRGYDEQEVTPVPLVSGDGESVALRPEGGQTRIGLGAENVGKLRLALANLDPANEYIAFAVASDSFMEFNYVKRLFIAKGFNYMWLPLPKPLHITRTTESTVDVQ